ncbi:MULTISPECIES: energy-coupling factor ABC transporter ATP-binding protein [unclassified Paludibacterium]|uniref:energy-coupling factor ABC transporter ATP-binding protein n=1 Tax=unclassified Paludibacterium TaxID=2618429 RepID=UPI001C0434D9|nr:ABC transporter ATP-binding protein [Paludibacterium sp. B53371]BEV72142.1 hypothetical protein THUN1379_16240 [Paludibacterium sp. THUN1379]
MALIHFEQASLTRRGASAPVLSGLDFTLAAGESLAVLGGCGSGKTTLANWLAGWVPHALPATTAGLAMIDGAPLAGQHPARLAERVQLVQASPYVGLSGCAFTVEAEVAFGPENLGLAESEIRLRVAEALALCEAEDLAGRHPATLSGGEAQRVAVAAALVMRPQILLLDEAFSRLTPLAASRILARLSGLTREGMALVLFEKRFDLAASMAQRVVLLQEGRQLACDSPAVVFDQALTHVCASDALRAAHQARSEGLWRASVTAPLSAAAAPAQFMAVLHG